MSVPQTEEALVRTWWGSLAAGLIFATGALFAAPLAGVNVNGVFGGREGELTWVTLFAGVLITGWFCWWLMVARPQRLSPMRGIVTGLLVGLCSYPVVVALADVFQRDASPAEGVLERVRVILEISAFSLATTGFAAMLAMGAVGAIAALILRPAYPFAAAREWGLGARQWLRVVGALALTLLILLVGLFVWLSILPLNASGLMASRAASRPAASHAEALSRFEAIRAEEARLPLHPRCGSMLLSHGRRVAQAVIFFHGLTNCPAQADELAPKLFELGYNVYVPRMPGHGEVDQMTMSLANFRAEHAVEVVDDAIDLASGLGDEVIVVGLSAGGNMAMWAGQHRADARHTLGMAPFLGPHVVPAWANRAATSLLLALPNMMIVWNPLEPNGPPEMDYAYPRVASHALGQFMRLGEVLADQARTAMPRAAGLAIVINEADYAVNNYLARGIAESWQAHGRQVDLRMLPVSQRLLHDLIDPRQAGANTEFVYALLVEMIALP